MKYNTDKDNKYTEEELHVPMRWQKFKSQPIDFQIQYIEYLKYKFNATQTFIAEKLFKIHVSTFCKYNTETLNIIFFGNKMSKDEKRNFLDFVSLIEAEEELMLSTTKHDVDHSTQLKPVEFTPKEMPIVIDDLEHTKITEERKTESPSIRRYKNPNFKSNTRVSRFTINFDGEIDHVFIADAIRKNVPKGSEGSVYIDIKF